MSNKFRFRAAFLLCFSLCFGFVIVWRNYVIVIGQTQKPVLVALNKDHELKLHLRGALNNGLTKDEIKEVLLQTAIYCGVPAAVVAFRAAKEVFASEK